MKRGCASGFRTVHVIVEAGALFLDLPNPKPGFPPGHASRYDFAESDVYRYEVETHEGTSGPNDDLRSRR